MKLMNIADEGAQYKWQLYDLYDKAFPEQEKKPLHVMEQLVDDGISGKVTKINDDSQEKLQNAMEKIVNESSGGLICIII